MSKLTIPSTVLNMQMPTEKPRLHMGISSAGELCERKLWLNFRWAVIEHFSADTLRLFRVGHKAEEFMVSDLRSAGIELKYVLDDQLYIDFGKHVGGSPDGIGRGFVEAPEKWHIVEFKTSNDKNFKLLVKHGMPTAKPVHDIQTQCYMYGASKKLGLNIDRTFYLANNKNDSKYYQERTRLDKEKAIVAIERLQRIAMSERIPEPISTNPALFSCKWCPCHSFCFEKQLTHEVNCRTCAHVTPLEDGTWRCEKYNGIIPSDFTYKGCSAHVLHPDLVPYDVDNNQSDEWNACYNNVINGEKGLSSEKVIEIFEKEANNNVVMEKKKWN